MTHQDLLSPTTPERSQEALSNESLTDAAQLFLKNRFTETIVRSDGSIERKLSTSRLSPFSPIDVATVSHEGEVTSEVTQWDGVSLDHEVFSWSNKSDAPTGTVRTNGSRETSNTMNATDYATAIGHIEAASRLFEHVKPSLKQQVSKKLGALVGRKTR